MMQWKQNGRIGQWNAMNPEGAGAGNAVADLPTRSEISDEYKWKLEDIYQDQATWDKDAATAREMTKTFVSYRGRLGESGETLLAALQVMDGLTEIVDRLYIYAHMRMDEDNTDSSRQALEGTADALATEIYSQLAFFEPELLSLSDDAVEGFFKAEPGLEHYRFYLSEILRQKPHVLSVDQEQLLAQASEVLGAPRQIFEMLNDADLRFGTVQDEQGNEIELTHGRYGLLRESRNRDVRKNAFEAMYAAYDGHKNMLAATYGATVKRGVFMANVRHYESVRQMSMFSDNVPVSVYDSLIEAVHESLPAMTRYMNLRKRVLGIDELHLYDLDVPLVGDVNIEIPYDEAVSTVLQSVGPLGEDYHRVASTGLKSGWVDVFETRGKRSGGYQWSAHGTHPYILLNYQARLDDMFTLAHELGHAMHSYYSHSHQPHVYSDYTIFVAEVASTLNENLLMHHLKTTTDDRMKKAYIVNHHLDTIRGTLLAQTMFAEFEKLAHAHVEAGKTLTVEWLTETCIQLNERFYGSACKIDPQVGLLWSRIPHFHRPFYVYKYATGISAATALSERILKNGEPAAADYLTFLKGGSHDYPIQLLRGAGVDMESPEPVKATLALFSDLVSELETLIG